jgi:5-methylcytosine-specific restriction enzyme subunit McrC
MRRQAVNPTVIRLTEHRTRELRLPPSEVAYLLTHAKPFVEVVPCFRRGVYRVTARGVVGRFNTPGSRFIISPKIPWPNVRMLLGLSRKNEHAASCSATDAGLLELFASEFLAQYRAVLQVGLVPDYREQDGTGPFLRGKLRMGDQIRDAAARVFPDRFQFTESVLSLDTPWNRIVRATALRLFTCPELSPKARAELEGIMRSLDGISEDPITDADFAVQETEPRLRHYRELTALCRVLFRGLGTTLGEPGEGAFLIDLYRAFERYVAAGMLSEPAARPEWSVEAQPEFSLGTISLIPDLLIRRRGRPRIVLDCKWKVPDPTPKPDDLHQILAYATITKARHVGLVYPGSRFARRTIPIPGSDVVLSLFRIQVVGQPEECAASLRRLLGVCIGRV